MLFSTKRKWEKLINSANEPLPLPPSARKPVASESQAQPLAPSTLPPDSLKKRRLAAHPGEATTPSVRVVSPTGSIRSTATNGSVLRPENRPSPAYAPWDREAFLQRLGTFRHIDKWMAKPTAVNEVAWAKRGWVLIDVNRVKCNACRSEVVVKVETDDELNEEGKAVIERFEKMVVEEHQENCLWRKRGCDDTIHRLPLANPTTAKADFTTRYRSLTKIRDQIPPSLSYPEEVDPAALHYPSGCSNDGPVFEAAAILALFGWQNDEPGIPSLVACAACFRRLGLWLFTKSPDTAGNEVGGASMSRLDVISEHRDYCPWANARSQGKDAGWRVMLRALRRAPNSSSSASVYTVGTTGTGTVSIAPTTTSVVADGDERTETTLKKLKRLKTLYFGKKKGRKAGEGGESVPSTPQRSRPSTAAPTSRPPTAAAEPKSPTAGSASSLQT